MAEQEGRLWVVGIGPGSYEDMTIRAARILEQCDTIIGYTVYADLVRSIYPGKEFLTTPMRGELERCRIAFREASAGKKVAMVCSGDAGVYGMAGPVLELGALWPGIRVEIVPGVTSALSGAALLGAPLMHDFCLISLSDLLTPLHLIEKRIRAAAGSGFVIVFYNPSSRKRADYLQKACDLILRFRSPETMCGCVSRIGREGEAFRILTLKELREAETDMFTTAYVGNERTKTVGGKLVTERGYRFDGKENSDICGDNGGKGAGGVS